jgi:methenyltetrahydrofolate cyclohydrolase
VSIGDRPIGEYLDRLGAPGTAPYGGAVAGLCAAQAAALLVAVARHDGAASRTPPGGADTVRSPSLPADGGLVAESLDLMERDMAAVDLLLAAYARPRDGHGDASARAEDVQEALADAVGPQIGIVRVCGALVEAMRAVAVPATPGVAADLAAAVQMTRTAVAVARGNIAANAAMIDDPVLRTKLAEELSAASATLRAAEDLAAACG